MNLLTDALPKSFEIDGAVYPIHWDFRTALRIMEMFEDKELLPAEKQILMLQMLFDGAIPADLPKAIKLSMLFLDCGAEPGAEDGEALPPQRLYSFTKDANYIFTAISQTHGIDLQEADMHWWKFCTLFQDINEDCFFSKLIYLRKQQKAGKLTREEWQWYSSIKDIVDLEDDLLEEDESVKEFMSLLGYEKSHS